MTLDQNQIEQQVEHWLDNIVIGLNLCPFAKKPRAKNQIKISYCSSDKTEQVLQCLHEELMLLQNTEIEETETTLVVTPKAFSDFEEYNQFLDICDLLIQGLNLEGIIQIASFHPDYQFANTEKDEPGNFTNRSPFPIFHLIREQSISNATAQYQDSDRIPEFNMEKMESMNQEQMKKLFYYLFK